MLVEIHKGRNLRLEQLEDKRMLATMADVVFLVDESGSDAVSQGWVKDELIPRLEDGAFGGSLTNQGIADVQYGLVGFADSAGPSASGAHANSFIIDSVDDPLFGSLSDLVMASANLRSHAPPFGVSSTGEDGWDAIEHVVAEYNFRDGAVPVLILVQNEEGRIEFNEALTREGILASLESKNVLLNRVIVGSTGSGQTFSEDVFDLEPYGANSNLRLLGVEADQNDNTVDGQHDYYGFDTATNTTASAGVTTADAVQVEAKGSELL